MRERYRKNDERGEQRAGNHGITMADSIAHSSRGIAPIDARVE